MGRDREGVIEQAVEVLCQPSLAHVVDLVAFADGPAIVVANAVGRARLFGPGTSAVEAGRHPLGSEDPLAFTPLSAELARTSGHSEENAYPWCFERLRSLFDAPAAPDLAVVHTGSHYWPERGGHLGEHGSLSVLQSRAPLVVSGPGVTSSGMVPSACRVLDIAPTLAAAAGAPSGRLEAMEGRVLDEVVRPGEAERVVGLLWDGTNANALYHLATEGVLGNVARLFERGCALQGGAVAEFPSVTLTNHASALTGVGPGRHGIVHNAYFDRRSAARVLTNDATTWHRVPEWLAPGVTTAFEAAPGRTVCVNEPVDRGADYSTFDLVRRARTGTSGAAAMAGALPDPAADPHATAPFVAEVPDYAWATAVDALGLTQVLDLFSKPTEAPRLTWWNTTLTDAGHHAGGPHSAVATASLRDADARLGVFLDHLEGRGLLETTLVVLTADHGSEGADPACRGDFDEALSAAGLRFRDEAYGFVYLGVDGGAI